MPCWKAVPSIAAYLLPFAAMPRCIPRATLDIPCALRWQATLFIYATVLRIKMFGVLQVPAHLTRRSLPPSLTFI